MIQLSLSANLQTHAHRLWREEASFLTETAGHQAAVFGDELPDAENRSVSAHGWITAARRFKFLRDFK